jgi:hypothetical protein
MQLSVYYICSINYYLSYVDLCGTANFALLALFMSKSNNSIHDNQELPGFGSLVAFAELICHKTW